MNQGVNHHGPWFCYNTCKIVATNDLRVIGARFYSKQTTYWTATIPIRAGELREAAANKRRECGIVRDVFDATPLEVRAE